MHNHKCKTFNEPVKLNTAIELHHLLLCIKKRFLLILTLSSFVILLVLVKMGLSPKLHVFHDDIHFLTCEVIKNKSSKIIKKNNTESFSSFIDV